MLMIIFHVGEQVFAIDSSYVLEIIPLVKIAKVPHMSVPVAGVVNYNGKPVTIFDFSLLVSDRASQDFLTTRILMLTREPGLKDPAVHSPFLGLIVEKAVEVAEVLESDISGLDLIVNELPFLNGIATVSDHSLQVVDIPKLFTSLQAYHHATRA